MKWSTPFLLAFFLLELGIGRLSVFQHVVFMEALGAFVIFTFGMVARFPFGGNIAFIGMLVGWFSMLDARLGAAFAALSMMVVLIFLFLDHRATLKERNEQDELAHSRRSIPISYG
jgi:uncharacterized membrane protein